MTAPAPAKRRTLDATYVLLFLRDYAVLILIALVCLGLAFAHPAFFSTGNMLNILNQNVPLAIIAAAGTFVIISGNFDLSTGAIFSVGSVLAAWVAMQTEHAWFGLLMAPVIGLILGVLNGFAITTLKVHSFLATLAMSRVK
ncbi:ABC transporter permease [Nesterenkonia alba]|uniref:ABC transporter permease n=1 Tax=Nesterenkonia alba TaxID=515814 RepID=UPI0004179451|nr:ABC transporter permease [Nesterenkonia alba]